MRLKVQFGDLIIIQQLFPDNPGKMLQNIFEKNIISLIKIIDHDIDQNPVNHLNRDLI